MKRKKIFRSSLCIILFVLLVVALTFAETLNHNQTLLVGKFHILWGDPPMDFDAIPQYRFYLNDDEGISWKILLDVKQLEMLQATGDLWLFNNRRVAVKGLLLDKEAYKIAADDVKLEKNLAPQEDRRYSVSGSQPYIWILLRFSDNSSTPEQPAWFQSQALGVHPSMDHFWREVSFNNINLTGSDVVGWYNLPHPRSYYVYDMNGDGVDELNHDRAVNDGTAVADGDVYFPNFIGINLIFNGNLDGAAWGGSMSLKLDEQTRTYGVTWMPPGGWYDHGVLAHEMGHALGLGHCSGPYGKTYDSQWALMSSAHGTCAISDPTYGCLGVHTISYHKDKLNWIPAGNRWTTTTKPEVITLMLHDLALAAPGGQYHIVRLPKWTTNSNDFYTIEARRLIGYDQNIPGPAVLIHNVINNYAYVVDPDGNGDCNDDGAIWEPGESFSDNTNKIVVTVESSGSNYSLVTFTNAARSPVYVDRDNSGFEDGTSTHPWDTVWNGQGAVLPSGDIYIDPGFYPENITMRKSMTLRVWGTGIVTLGKTTK